MKPILLAAGALGIVLGLGHDSRATPTDPNPHGPEAAAGEAERSLSRALAYQDDSPVFMPHTMFSQLRKPDEAGACTDQQAFEFRTRGGLLAFRSSKDGRVKGRSGRGGVDLEFGSAGCRYRVTIAPVP